MAGKFRLLYIFWPLGGAFLGKFLILFSSKGGLGGKNLNFITDFGHKRAFFGGKLKIIGRHRGVNVDLKVDFAKKIIKNLAF